MGEYWVASFGEVTVLAPVGREYPKKLGIAGLIRGWPREEAVARLRRFYPDLSKRKAKRLVQVANPSMGIGPTPEDRREFRAEQRVAVGNMEWDGQKQNTRCPPKVDLPKWASPRVRRHFEKIEEETGIVIRVRR